MAIDDFWDWAMNPEDIKMKVAYYPNFNNKLDLFNGYISKLSAHSRGSAVDLTIVNLQDKKDLDMGGIFDLLDTVSNTSYPNINISARVNRALLKSVMEKYGFENYDKEWWHFSLIKEPFPRKPEDHFNFPVR
jgi:D-alanyl-D-alanine dipeptidase